MEFYPIYYPIKLDDISKKHLDVKTIFYLENKGLPSIIAPLGGTKYQTNVPFLIWKNENVIIGRTEGTQTIHYLVINAKTGNVYHQWNYDNPSFVFVNSSFEKLLTSNFVYFYIIKKLILIKALGAYYDNTENGGNFEKYANLLKEMILDIDERATQEGAWSTLIQEMSIGVI
jgi:hypothetical protein